MRRFQIGPKINEDTSIVGFLRDIENKETDAILISDVVYEEFFNGLEILGEIIIYEDYCKGEPNDNSVSTIIQRINALDINRIIGIGGGSVLDTAKLLCVEGAENTDQIYEEEIPLVRKKELILIPTTCGTGTEMTCVSVIDRLKEKSKIGKRIEANFADEVYLIPELLNRIPRSVFAYSSIDALIHAIEIFVSPKASNYSKLFCKEAISIIVEEYSNLSNSNDFDYQKRVNTFLLASNYAGIALANDVCGAVHACAMHYGSKEHVNHGEANYLFLVPVFKTYYKHDLANQALEDLRQVLVSALNLPVETSFEMTLHKLEELLNQVIPNKRLRDYGTNEPELGDYVDSVFRTQQRLLVNNAVELTKEEFLEIYQLAY